MRRSDRPLSPRSRALIGGAAVVQVALFVVARRDLRRRGDDELRGSRRAWRLATFVNFAGPLAYLACGRRRV